MSSVERRAWVRRRAATTSEEVSARMASGSEEGFSGPRRRVIRLLLWAMMVPLVLVVVEGLSGEV